MTRVVPEELISTFVNALILTLRDLRFDPEEARSIVWITKFPSERVKLEELISLCIDGVVARV